MQHTYYTWQWNWRDERTLTLEMGDNIKNWHPRDNMTFQSNHIISKNSWKIPERKDVIFKLRVCVCVQLLKNVWNILIHVVLFFIKWHVYEKKKTKQNSWKCQTENRKLQSPRIYIPFRCVIHLWKTVEICLTERRGTLISRDFQSRAVWGKQLKMREIWWSEFLHLKTCDSTGFNAQDDK